MTRQTVIKLILFNLALALINIVLFSGALVGLYISAQNPLTAAVGIAVIVLSILLFVYVNYTLLFRAPRNAPHKPEGSLLTLDDCARAAKRYRNANVKTYAKQLNAVLSQIERFKHKKVTIREVLLERFSEEEISYAKFMGAVGGLENTMVVNIKSMLTRILAFDEEEYERLLREDTRFRQSRLHIYNEYAAYVNAAVENGEQILIKLDQLILELSKLSTLNNVDISAMGSMKDIEALISDAKWYRQ